MKTLENEEKSRKNYKPRKGLRNYLPCTPKAFLIHAKLFRGNHLNANRSSPKIVGVGYVKKHDFHANPLFDVLRMGREKPTNSIISRDLLLLEQLNWCQIKA